MDGVIIEDTLMSVRQAMGVETLKDKQKEAITNFVNGRNCFVILRTGYGKSLCYMYALLPYVFDHLRNKEKSSIILCVSPLVSLMMDLVNKYSSQGLSAQYVGDHREGMSSISRRITDGVYQLVIITPEALFRSKHWHDMLLSSKYQEDVVAFVVDEAHCVKSW